MSILYGVGLGILLVALVAVLSSAMLSSQISREEEERPEPEMPALGKVLKILWIDGQPTVSYSILRLPRHWLN